MKIAIYEPEPRVCGPMSWAYHLQRGFAQLGHQCDVVTFTRLGKARVTWGVQGQRLHARWWNRSPDVVTRYSVAAEVLDGYDLVVLSDVRTIMHDKEALRGRSALVADKPDYLNVLTRTTTPFTFALHGNNYPLTEVTFAGELVDLPNFTGSAITHSPTSPLLSMSRWPNVTWLTSPLPYTMVNDVSAPPTSGTAVGITGRYVPNKGHHLMALAAATGRFNTTTVELWGACSVGAGASQTYKTYEALVKDLGLHGTRFGNQQHTAAGGDILKPYPWTVRGVDGTQVDYLGSYSNALETCARLAVHVDHTASSFSDGMEYSQFESIDAGCRQVSVRSMWNQEFHGVVLPEIEKIPGEKRLLHSESGTGLMDRLAGAVNEALDMSTHEQRTSVIHNRAVLDELHDPAKVATTFIETMGNR